MADFYSHTHTHTHLHTHTHTHTYTHTHLNGWLLLTHTHTHTYTHTHTHTHTQMLVNTNSCLLLFFVSFVFLPYQPIQLHFLLYPFQPVPLLEVGRLPLWLLNSHICNTLANMVTPWVLAGEWRRRRMVSSLTLNTACLCTSSSSVFPDIFLGFTILGEVFAYVTFFYSNHRGSHIPSSCIVCAVCVFVAGIHLSKTWMSGSFECMWWNACVHRLDLGFILSSEGVLGE